MGGSLNHHQLEELLGAYALDAVDGPEAEAVELHLRECPRCRDEVAAHREAAALLAHIGAPAPAGVWERIAGGLQEAPPPRIELARLATVTPLRAEPSRRYPIVLVAAAAMAAAVSVVLGVRLNEQSGRMTELRGVVSDLRGVIDGQALSSEVLRGLLAEDAQVVHLVSSGGAPQADALLLPDGRGYLVNVALAALPDSQTYQLWGQVGNQTVSLGLLGSSVGQVPFRASAAGLTLLAITAEPAGGVVVSRNPAVASAPVAA